MPKDKKKVKTQNYTDENHPRHAALHLAQPLNPSLNTAKIVSYNIRHGKNIDQAIQLFENHPDLKEPDIICLQEMSHEGVKKIAIALKYNYVYYPAVFHPRSKKDFGNAILAKWPMSQDKKIILPNLKRQRLQRIAVRATVNIHNQRITVFCVHMKVFLKPNLRSDQIDKLLSFIPKDTKYCIVAGDFNTFNSANRKAIYDPFVGHSFKLATEKIGWTYKHWYLLNKHNALDHIYTMGMNIVKVGKVENRKPSDHIPIWAELSKSNGKAV